MAQSTSHESMTRDRQSTWRHPGGGRQKGPHKLSAAPESFQGDLLCRWNRAELCAEDMASQPLPVSAAASGRGPLRRAADALNRQCAAK